jgi:hypothetical protein
MKTLILAELFRATRVNKGSRRLGFLTAAAQ